jgi:hypothetical protein
MFWIYIILKEYGFPPPPPLVLVLLIPARKNFPSFVHTHGRMSSALFPDGLSRPIASYYMFFAQSDKVKTCTIPLFVQEILGIYAKLLDFFDP